jgi:uncharacterized protein (TIGR02145 family)
VNYSEQVWQDNFNIMKNKHLGILFLYIVTALSAYTQPETTKVPNQKFNCEDNFTDSRDGKIYSTVQIGSQCWMKENLNIGKILRVDQEQTNNGIIEKYCYDNLATSCDEYGGLYQWNEVMQYLTAQKSQGICPTGWHIPAEVEWDTLVAFLGGDAVAGGKIKQGGDSHFLSPNIGATNHSGFTALPGGYSYATGSHYFSNIQKVGYFWSSTADNETDVWFRSLSFAGEKINRYVNYKSTGASVRCLRDN